MKYIFLFSFLTALFVNIHAQQIGISPLESNPGMYFKSMEMEAKLKTAKMIYPLGSKHFYIFDTLSLPFVDDFSRNYFKSYAPWDNPVPVDSVAYLYQTLYPDEITPYALPVFPFPYKFIQTYTYTVDPNKPLPEQVDSVANDQILWVKYKDSINPFIPVDTVDIFQVIGKRYFYNSLTNSIDSNTIDADGFLTADTTDTIKVFYPIASDKSKWIDNYVYHNSSMAIDPVSAGVVTFDGTDEFGKAYKPGVVSSYGIADYFTSKPIDLAYLPSDSIYLSFYYQRQGRGYAPGTGDSLVVEFRNPLTGKWHHQWAQEGGPLDSVFQQVILPVTDPLFLQKGFQFRFKNYANLSGNLDHWNVDYIKLDLNRSQADTILDDVVFVEIQPTLLRRYREMPYTQFTQDDVNNKWSNKIANRGITPDLICYQYYMTDESNTILNHFTQDYTPSPSDTNTIQPYITNGYTNFSRWASPDFNFNFQIQGMLPFPDSADFLFTHYIENFGTDVNPENDTIFIPQLFHNYFAYDDGTAEVAYWLGFPGSVAVKFTNHYPDTLRAIQYYFTPFRENVETKFFDIKVWSSLTPEDELYSQSRQIKILEQEPNAKVNLQNNGYSTFILDEPIYLPAGDFYIGWNQNQNYKINIGFDRNTDASNYTFYNTQNSWDTSYIKGSIMMRPMVGPPVTKEDIGVDKEDMPTGLTLYPNPATDIVNFRGTNAAKVELIQLIDLSGKVVREYANPYALSFNVSGLTQGMYLAKFFHMNGQHSGTYKIIVQ